MSFDDALTIVLSQDGMAMKTQSMAGYISRTTDPSQSSDFGIAFRYRGHPLTGTRKCPVFPINIAANGDFVSGAPDIPAACTVGTPMDGEFVRNMLDSDWYTCSSAECEEALGKIPVVS